MWLIVYVCCVEKGLKSCWIIVDVTSCLCGCELCDVMKMVISYYLCELVIRIILRHWLWQVLCALRKNGYLRGCTISRDVSRAGMVTIIEGRVVRRDRCMDRYVPHGSPTERQWVRINRSNMQHYTWHCIPLHWAYLSLVNLILCFADLVNASMELVIDEYWVYCWGCVICLSVVVELRAM